MQRRGKFFARAGGRARRVFAVLRNAPEIQPRRKHPGCGAPDFGRRSRRRRLMELTERRHSRHARGDHGNWRPRDLCHPSRSKAVAALYERRTRDPFGPENGGHRPPLQASTRFLNGLADRQAAPGLMMICCLPAAAGGGRLVPGIFNPDHQSPKKSWGS